MAKTAKNTISASLQIQAKKMTPALASALYTEALLVEQESRNRTPVLTGALRASHETTEPDITQEDISVEIRVGGPAAPYAVEVHENVQARHRVGQAKFLETAVYEASGSLAARIAERMKRG